MVQGYPGGALVRTAVFESRVGAQPTLKTKASFEMMFGWLGGGRGHLSELLCRIVAVESV